MIRTCCARAFLFIVYRQILIAFFTVQLITQHGFPAGFRYDPGPAYQRRIVAHVLVVAACQLRHPMIFFIFVISDDRLFHYLRIPESATDSALAKKN